MNIAVESKDIRKMALLLLDNYDGVDVRAYAILAGLLTETGNEDILEHVDVYKDAKRHCAFIGEDYAEEELTKLTESTEPTELEEGVSEKIGEARIADPIQNCPICHNVIASVNDNCRLVCDNCNWVDEGEQVEEDPRINPNDMATIEGEDE